MLNSWSTLLTGYADLSGKTVCGRDAAVERTGVSSGQRSCERPYRDVGAGPQAQQGLRSAAGIHGGSCQAGPHHPLHQVYFFSGISTLGARLVGEHA